MPTAAVDLILRTNARQKFVNDILELAGGDVRVFWTPNAGDKAVTIDEVGNLITWDGDPAARITPLGKGYQQSFNASQFGGIADSDRFSFGNGTIDFTRGFTIIGLHKPSDNAASKALMGKYATGAAQREFFLQLNSAEAMQFGLYDESADVSPSSLNTATYTPGTWALTGVTYSAATGGATAANNMAQYKNGALDATAAPTNNASYVAMENGTALLGLGSRQGAGAEAGYLGAIALLMLVSGVVGAVAQREIAARIRAFFGVPL